MKRNKGKRIRTVFYQRSAADALGDVTWWGEGPRPRGSEQQVAGDLNTHNLGLAIAVAVRRQSSVALELVTREPVRGMPSASALV